MKDRIDKGEFKVKYCPTELMVADFFTKPLQGSLFKRLSAVIMGEVDLLTFLNNKPSPSKERVEVPTGTKIIDCDDVKIKPSYASVLKGSITSINEGGSSNNPHSLDNSM